MSRLILMMVILTGCGTTYRAEVAQPTNKMDTSVRERCQPIPVELQHKSHMGNLETAYDDLIGLYGKCAIRDKAKADWIESQGQ